jgi:hypothetical protein
MDQIMVHPYTGERRRGASCQFMYSDNNTMCGRMDGEHGPVPTVQPGTVEAAATPVAADDGWHALGDICATYKPGEGVMRADGTPATIAELEQDDVFSDPSVDPEHRWWRITEVHEHSDGTVHLEIQDATCERCKQDPITDFDCGLCDDCTKNNADRVVL